MNYDEQLSLWIRSLSLINVDDAQIIEASETDMIAIMQATEQLAATTPNDTPADLSLHRLLILTAGLIMQYRCQVAGIQTEPPKPLGREWLTARAELLELRLGAS